jgi:hypothetical protein
VSRSFTTHPSPPKLGSRSPGAASTPVALARTRSHDPGQDASDPLAPAQSGLRLSRARGFHLQALIGLCLREALELIVRLWVRAVKSKTRTADDEAHSVQVFKHDAQRSGGPNYGSEGWGFDPSGRTIEIASRGGC